MPRRVIGPLYQNLFLAGASACVALLAGEVLLRLVLPNQLDGYYVWPPGLEAEFAPDPALTPGIAGPSRFSINELGVRGDPLTADRGPRILTLGGSTTECLYLDQTETWPYLLQQRLSTHFGWSHVWVGNAGMSGRHSRDHIVQAEKLLNQLPGIDLVILLAGQNDLMLRLGEDTDWRPLSAKPAEYENYLLKHAFTVLPPTNAGLPLYKRTEIWQLLRRVKAGSASRSRESDEPFFMGKEGAFYARAREHRRNALRIRESLPDLAPALAEYVDNLRRIVVSTRRRGSDIVLLTQPTMYRVDLPRDLEELLWFGWIGRFRKEGNEYYSVDALSEGIALYNDALLELCAEQAVQCIDVASMLPKDTTVMYDDVHFNEAGARQLADIVARELVQAGWLDESYVSLPM